MILRICNKPVLAALIALCLGAFLEVAAGEEPAAEDPGPEVRLDFSYGQLGPRREPEFIAGEWIAARIQITGLSTSRDDNEVRFSIRIVVTNETNEVIGRFQSIEFQGPFVLGGNTFTQALLMPVPVESPAGKYSAEIIVTDRMSSRTVHSNSAFELLPPSSFGAQSVYLAKDKDGIQLLSAVLPAGEIIWLHSTISGIKAKDNKANFTTSIDILDEKQNPIGNGPVHSMNHRPFHSSDSSEGIPTAYPMLLNKPGKFTLRLKTKDEHSGKEVTHELSIVVIDTY